ncbi:MAG: hypothetical protein M1826_006917 [Phylliscum demangeonii]|nr:MAG: hypothetical protein M1826_006917 [Phylliscum demangeonii]
MAPMMSALAVNGTETSHHARNTLDPDPDSGETRPSYATGLKAYPVTLQRPPYVPRPEDKLVDAGTPRANMAATAEKPDGTTEDGWMEKHQHQTVVAQHSAYFDLDNDGIIWPTDTFRALRGWGWPSWLCLAGVLVTNGVLSYPTAPGLLPDPFFRIWLTRMHKAKHGSDSMTYDHEGRFRPQQFEEIFTKYDRDGKGGLSKADLYAMWKGQAMVWDFFGWSATMFEWVGAYLLIWPDDGILRKEDIRAIFDGSIFYRKAEEHQRKMAAKQAAGKKDR